MAGRKKRYSIQRNGVNPQHFSSGQIKFYLYLIPLAVFMALPSVFIFFNAFKPMDELFAYPPRFYVRNPTWNNFTTLFSMTANSDIPASRYLFNSILSTALVVVGTVWISVSAGYTFSKKRGKGISLFQRLNTLALMFVPVAVAIPRYYIIVTLGLQNNFLAHIVPLLAMPVGVFLVKQFIDQIPDALIEAAVIDGAGEFLILRRIIIPLAMPALSTVVILAFQSSWNSVEASTMYIDNEALKNFAFYLSTFSGASNGVAGQGVAAATTLIQFLPNLVLFIIMQSKVMDSMVHSGIK